MTIMIPIIIENVKNDYTFVFSINELLKNKFIITNTINRNRRPHFFGTLLEHIIIPLQKHPNENKNRGNDAILSQ